MKTLCRILVPADFSMSSDAALDYATALAGRVGATVDLLHVWDLDAPARGPRTAFFADSSDGLAMEQALSRRSRGRVEVRGRLEFGELSDTIARVATTDHFDLVVMGGANVVAHKVALSVRCPVITINEAMEPDSESSAKAAQVGAGDDARRVEARGARHFPPLS